MKILEILLPTNIWALRDLEAVFRPDHQFTTSGKVKMLPVSEQVHHITGKQLRWT